MGILTALWIELDLLENLRQSLSNVFPWLKSQKSFNNKGWKTIKKIKKLKKVTNIKNWKKPLKIKRRSNVVTVDLQATDTTDTAQAQSVTIREKTTERDQSQLTVGLVFYSIIQMKSLFGFLVFLGALRGRRFKFTLTTTPQDHFLS